jgi:heme-degrading monooxygenase HmoA
MILAASRFRVTNGLEAVVRNAFLDRPHLVDQVAGFLGMEVLTDSADTAVFYLMTRWTDAASFRTWHASDAHRLSHQGIPRGLKLDKSFTQTLVLDRLHDPLRPLNLEQFTADASPLLATYLDGTRAVHLLAADLNGTIRQCNRQTAELLTIPREELIGQTLWRFLPEKEKAGIQERITRNLRGSSEKFYLNLIDQQQARHTLECQFDMQPDGFTILGETPRKADEAFNEELVLLNNELAVMTREHARKNKELERVKAELEKTLEELQTTHWHLRKIQEVLPICMRCDKIKAGEFGWQDVVQYLKENALFLSHGYCPACQNALAEEWGLAPESERKHAPE